MSTTQENAAIIRGQTGKVGEAVASITHAMDLLNDAINTANGAMGQTAAADVLNGRVHGVINVLESAQGEVMTLNEAFETAATAGG